MSFSKLFASFLLVGFLLLVAWFLGRKSKSCETAPVTVSDSVAYFKRVADSLQTQLDFMQPQIDHLTDKQLSNNHALVHTIIQYRDAVIPYDSSIRTIRQHAAGYGQWATAIERRAERNSRQIDSLRSVERKLLKPFGPESDTAKPGADSKGAGKPEAKNRDRTNERFAGRTPG